MQQLATISEANTITVFSPAASTLLVVGPAAGAQTTVNVANTDDATLYATGGTSAGGAATLSVSTSVTADHSTTCVSVRPPRRAPVPLCTYVRFRYSS